MTQATQSPPRNLTLAPERRQRLLGIVHDAKTKPESIKTTRPLRELAEGFELVLAIMDAQEQVIARLQGSEPQAEAAPEPAAEAAPAPRGRHRRQEQADS